jgi:LPXTG-site transpeptidase (sortase) family protein
VPTPAARVSVPSPTAEATPAPSESPVVYISIERLGIEAPVMELGLDANLVPLVPNGSNVPAGEHPADVVAWYNFSRKPGHDGNVVMSGHVNWSGRIGAFGRLGDLEVGDFIRVFQQDGSASTYQVTENRDIPWDDPEAVQLMLPTEDEVVTLITCGGTWIPDSSSVIGGNYTHRTIVRAVPAEGA